MERNFNFREADNIQLPETISAIHTSNDYIAIGCLDDSFSLWKSDAIFPKEPLWRRQGNSMGIIDLQLSESGTNLAISYMDSTIQNWDIDTKELVNIQCGVMENWKMEFLGDEIVTSGELGKINFYNIFSAERTNKMQAGEVFLSSLAKSSDSNFLAVGGVTGEVHIIKLEAKDKKVCLSPHYRGVKGLTFVQGPNKLVSCSDDSSLKVIDVFSEKVINSLEGHKDTVTKVISHPNNPNVVFSCSFDKTVKGWDLREGQSVATAMTSSPLWSCGFAKKYILAGGENANLSVLALE